MKPYRERLEIALRGYKSTVYHCGIIISVLKELSDISEKSRKYHSEELQDYIVKSRECSRGIQVCEAKLRRIDEALQRAT